MRYNSYTTLQRSRPSGAWTEQTTDSKCLRSDEPPATLRIQNAGNRMVSAPNGCVLESAQIVVEVEQFMLANIEVLVLVR